MAYFFVAKILLISCMFAIIDAAPVHSTTMLKLTTTTNRPTTTGAIFPYSVVKNGQGEIYDWQNDRITVRLTGQQTQGLFTLTEDDMKPTFNMGLHLHRQHRETFHILEGDVEFRLNGKTHVAQAGTTVHVPSNTPHAVRVINGRKAKMIMLYSPAGFEHFLKQMKTFTDAQFSNEKFMKEFNEKNDNFILE